MNKLYACMQQRGALFATIFMLLIAPLSMLTFGQSPCTSPVVREATNAKSTNGNLYDDITIAMTNLLGNGTEAAWVMESGATFTENPDGTARLQGTVKQFGDYVTPRRLVMDVTLGGRSFTPDASGPYNQTGVPTDGWYYYHSLSGTFTGLDAIAGGKLSLTIHMHPFQVGIGANQMFVAEDQVANGAGGWFEWTVVTQPTDPALQFTNYIPGITISDFALLLSGTPSAPCALNGSIGDQVYCDVNNNGIFDAGDIAATGLTVTLCDANSTPIATQTVDANGKYLFTGLPAGSYIVKFPATTLDGKPQRDLGNISVNLTEGQNYLDADKGYYKNPCLNDTEAPTFVNCPSDITVTTDCRTNKATATWTTPTATDNCTTASVSSSHQSGASFNVGTTVVTFTATDAAGNTKTCTFNVIVNAAIDTENPVFANCPTSILKDVVNSTSTCWTINWTAPTATDNCSTPVVTSNYNSGDCFPSGLTVVTYTATDASGNTATCSFGVTITKTTSCSVTGNTISKSCVNNLPALTGSTLAGHEYLWLVSTVSCPTQASQAISGATGQSYNLPSRVVATTYFVRLARPIGCTTWNTVNASNCITVDANECAPVSCTVTGNTLTKSCVNNIPVITGTNLGNYEYVWLKSTTSCPTQASQAIAGATAQNYTLPSRVTVTTYFVRCARPVGCTTWGPVNESNCITVYATDCAPVNCTVTGNTLTKSCVNNLPVITGSNLGNYEYVWLKSTTGCPTQASQAIAGATAQNYSLPSSVTVTTYFVRCARPVGCTTWGTVNESNCITVLPTDCIDPCAGVASVRSVTNTYDYCGNATRQPYVALFNGKYYTAGTDLKFTEYTNGTALLKGTIYTGGVAYWVNMTFSGKTSASSGSPKIMLCATGKTSGSTWYYYTTSGGQINTPTGIYNITRQGPAFQVGQFANLQENTYGASGWFYGNGTVTGDFNFNLGAVEACGSVVTPTCSTNFISTKCYRIISKKSGKALDVYGNGMNNDCPIIQWGYNATANQQWRLFSLGSGYFRVMARNSGKNLACHYTADASAVYQYDYYAGGYKDWKVECVGNTGYYRLIHRASGKCLDVSGGSIADGAKMQIYPWNGGDNQLFKIEEVAPAPGAYSLSSTALAMNATAESDRVRINWLSNTGYDNDFYTVEKMNPSTGDFEKMALVNNTQFDDQVQTHVVNDVQPTEGDNFYRVKVTLNDGQEKLTDVKKVTFKRMVGFGAFPNPASDELNVNLSEYTGKAVDIVIYNTFGKAVLREHVENVANATHSLNISEFAAGQYHIRVSSEGKRDATQPVVIQK